MSDMSGVERVDNMKPRKLWVLTDGKPGVDSCKFIELEDDQGESVGESSGVTWHDKEYTDGWAVLGPFYSAKEVDELNDELNNA